MARDKGLSSKGIGGSEIAAVVGMHPTRSAFDVWAEKSGLLDDVIETTNNKRMRWGKLLEQTISVAYADTFDVQVEWCDQTKQVRGLPILYTIDAFARLPNQYRRVLDCKNVATDQRFKWGQPGTDDVPDEYALQLHYYCGATVISGEIPDDQLTGSDFATLFGGSDFVCYPQGRAREVEKILLAEAIEFWDKHVMTGKPPEIKDTEHAQRFLKHRFPRNLTKLRRATDEEAILLGNYLAAKATLKEVEEIEADLKVKLQLVIGDSEGLDAFGVGQVTWKKDSDSIGPDYKAMAKWLAGNEDIAALEKRFECVTRQGARKLIPKKGR